MERESGVSHDAEGSDITAHPGVDQLHNSINFISKTNCSIWSHSRSLPQYTRKEFISRGYMTFTVERQPHVELQLPSATSTTTTRWADANAFEGSINSIC